MIITCCCTLQLNSIFKKKFGGNCPLHTGHVDIYCRWCFTRTAALKPCVDKLPGVIRYCETNGFTLVAAGQASCLRCFVFRTFYASTLTKYVTREVKQNSVKGVLDHHKPGLPTYKSGAQIQSSYGVPELYVVL